MRRHVIVMLALVLAAVIGVTATAVGIGYRQDQVEYTVSSELGDKSAAYGLQVSAVYSCRNRAYWFVDHTFDQTDTTATQFQFYTFQPEFAQEASDYTSATLELRIADMDIANDFKNLMGKELAEYPGLLGAYKELYDATPEGELTNTYVLYADYCEYYPLYAYIYLPGNTWPFFSVYSGSGSASSNELAAKAINEYLKIPVLEDDWVQVVVDKTQGTQGGYTLDLSMPRKDTDYYEMGSAGVTGDGVAYFAINALTTAGELVDTSHIPGGYGLYSFTFDERGEIDPDSLTTVLPLDPMHVPLQMYLDETNGHILYFTALGEDRYLTVIDPEEKEVLQQLCLFETAGEEDEPWFWYRLQEDILLCVEEYRQIQVYRRGEGGLYSLDFTAPMGARTAADAMRYFSECVFDYNGEYLAAVEQLYDPATEDEKHWYRVERAGFRLEIYSRDGLVYRGDYTASLEQPQEDSSPCRVYSIVPSWQ